MDDEWTDWIEHDGKGCSVPAGVFLRIRSKSIFDGFEWESCGTNPGDDLAWRGGGIDHSGRVVAAVIRYRIRRPRAMAQIRALLENLPERVDA